MCRSRYSRQTLILRRIIPEILGKKFGRRLCASSSHDRGPGLGFLSERSVHFDWRGQLILKYRARGTQIMPAEPDRYCYWRDDAIKNGMHALLIGVSEYPFASHGKSENKDRDNFNIGQLSAQSRTVAALADWLIQNRASLAFPLKSVRLLVSPSPNELAENPRLDELPTSDLSSVSAAAKNWQRDAAQSTANSTLFYFAGHGIQRTRGDSVLLLKDFLDPASNTDLDRTIGFNNVYNGMGNFRSFPNLAHTQFYFVDACHSDIEALALFEEQEPAQIFKVDRGGEDDRIAPIFYSSAPGKAAMAQRNQQTLFGSDLLACLAGAAAENTSLGNGVTGWVVTVGKLHDALLKMVDRYNALCGATLRSCVIDKFSPGALEQPICTVADAPSVLCTLDLFPPEAGKVASLTFDIPGVDMPITVSAPESPFICTKPAGIYALHATIDAAHRAQYCDHSSELVSVTPPYFYRPLRFG